MKSVIFIAPPAAGKGTQSENLMQMGYIHISTGDMLREEIASKSPLGLSIQDIMAQGGLVSDEIVLNLVKKRLKAINKPFILDGFPRTLNQAKLLDNLFKELNIYDYEVVYLNLALEEALKRALGRLTCSNKSCGATYHKYNSLLKPKKDGICDKCGNVLKTRDDDNEEAFKVRFETFLQNIQEIKEFYQEKNKLHIVDASIEANEMTDRIKEILK